MSSKGLALDVRKPKVDGYSIIAGTRADAVVEIPWKRTFRWRSAVH